ncbi:hypothetical protein [Xylanibacter rarus]|uniref:hypothetical protein n=1 Tax=Xylanibacter rarus TaxID=1676614 RepID=UPI003AB967E0
MKPTVQNNDIHATTLCKEYYNDLTLLMYFDLAQGHKAMPQRKLHKAAWAMLNRPNYLVLSSKGTNFE